MKADSALLNAIADLNNALVHLAVPSMVIGGIAVIARGVPRSTLDVDATVWGAQILPEEICSVFAEHSLEPRIPDPLAFVAKSQVLLLVHEPTGTRVDLSLGWLPFEKDAMDRATEVSFGDVTFRAATVEDLIIYKAVAWRKRDRDDIHDLLLLHFDSVDLDRTRKLVEEFATVLEDPERVEGFDEIVRKVAAVRSVPSDK